MSDRAVGILKAGMGEPWDELQATKKQVQQLTAERNQAQVELTEARKVADAASTYHQSCLAWNAAAFASFGEQNAVFMRMMQDRTKLFDALDRYRIFKLKKQGIIPE